MFSGRVTLARMDLSSGRITEEEVDTSDLWEIRVRHGDGQEQFLAIQQSDGGVVSLKQCTPGYGMAIYPSAFDQAAVQRVRR